MAYSSQDLYYSYKMYKLVNKSSIKDVIVSYSVFSPLFSCLKSRKVNFYCALYKAIFDIKYKDENLAKEKKLYLKEILYKIIFKNYLKKLKINENYRGEKFKFTNNEIDEEKLSTIVKIHTRLNTRNHDEDKYIELLAKEAAEHNQSLTIVITPRKKIYADKLSNKEKLFGHLYKLVQNYKNVKIINLYDYERFFDQDFCDAVHLNNEGRMKLTEILNS